jgi:serine/threonine-protein kinase
LKTDERKKLVEGAINGRYLPTGHLIYALEGALVASAFDPTRLELVGSPVSVLDGIVQTGFVAQVAVADAGTLVYLPGIGGIPTKTLVWRDRQGGDETAINAPVKAYVAPRLSPNDDRIAVEVREKDNSNIWIYHFANETLTPLTFGDTSERWPLWTPDGKRIVFDFNPWPGNPSVFWTAADGMGKPEPLAAAWPRSLSPDAVSPDGKLVVCIDNNPQETGADLMIVPLEAGGQPRPLPRTRGNQAEAEISPDGRWIAYQSDESGTRHVYVRPFPNVEQGQWQVSTDGGSRPLWARNGRELFYVSPDQLLMVVSVRAGASFTPGKAQPLFDVRDNVIPLGGPVAMNFDISLDGKRFLMVKYQTTAGATTFVAVQNWFEELKRLVPTNCTSRARTAHADPRFSSPDYSRVVAQC